MTQASMRETSLSPQACFYMYVTHIVWNVADGRITRP
jgi:hypothetical protein